MAKLVGKSELIIICAVPQSVPGNPNSVSNCDYIIIIISMVGPSGHVSIGSVTRIHHLMRGFIKNDIPFEGLVVPSLYKRIFCWLAWHPTQPLDFYLPYSPGVN